MDQSVWGNVLPAVLYQRFLQRGAAAQLSLDSRELRPGDVFLAVPGLAADGRDFVPQALAAGVSLVCYEAADWQPSSDDERLVPVPGLRALLPQMAASFYNFPSRSLQIAAVTGTDGKTSVSHYLAQAWQQLGWAAAVIGTLGAGRLGHLQPFGLTTPDVVQMQQLLGGLRDQGVTHVALEASSHALDQGRLLGVEIDWAVLTQVSRDHLDYHGSLDAYQAAKARLFTWSSLQGVVINADDAWGRALNLTVPGIDYTRLTQDAAAIQLRDMHINAQGQRQLSVTTPWGEVNWASALMADFNISNALAVLGVLGQMDVPMAQAALALQQLTPVPGRLQVLHGTPQQPTVVIDFAHTPHALSAALQAVRQQASGQVWCVFGCGGERDVGKRPLMGKVAAAEADHVILTADNPRGENLADIMADILAGIDNVAATEVEPCREKAVMRAVQRAGKNDIILLAGKGHEDTQHLADQVIAQSDADLVQLALAKIA